MNIQKAFSVMILVILFCSSNIVAYIDWINPILIPIIQRRMIRFTPVMVPVLRPINPTIIGAIAQRPQFSLRIKL